MSGLALDALPEWVSPAEMERSLDPLGLQQEADRYAERLLPGVTVQTSRARYLTFLCWARQHELSDVDTDRWEIALALGEHLRHLDDGVECSFLGKNVARTRGYTRTDRLPKVLHRQTARILYRGLLASTSAVEAAGETLAPLGARIARWFRPGRRTLPRRAADCEALPCVGWTYAQERRALAQALLVGTTASGARLATYRAVPVRLWASSWPAYSILRHALDTSFAQRGAAAQTLHEAAAFELAAYALKRLFLRLYRTEGALRGRLPTQTKLTARSAFVIDEDDLLHDVAAHLRRADALGGTAFLSAYGYARTPRSVSDLADLVLALHEQAKPEEPWVDRSWRVVRPGLAPASANGIHGYRLPSFAGLLGDLGHAANRAVSVTS